MYLTMNNWRHEHTEGNKLKVEHPGGSWVGLRLKTANFLGTKSSLRIPPTRHHSPRSSWVSRTDRLADFKMSRWHRKPWNYAQTSGHMQKHTFNNAANIIHFAHRRKRRSTFAQLARHTLLEGAGGIFIFFCLTRGRWGKEGRDEEGERGGERGSGGLGRR